MSARKPLLRRLGLHRYQNSRRDAGGHYRCQRCSHPGQDAYFDPERLPPHQVF